jgi:hypothetical protein
MIFKVIGILEIAFWIFVGIALIYLVIKRFRDRDKDTFEKRNN